MNKEISRREMVEELDNMLKYSTDAEVARLWTHATHTPASINDIESLRKQYEEEVQECQKIAEQGYMEAYNIICEQRKVNEQLMEEIAYLQQTFRLLKGGQAIDLNALPKSHFINSVEISE
jgi:hypothetical protein